MNVQLLYHTPQYHKLVESVARLCYQSYDKLNEESHKMLKGIMGKGHLSVGSVGNIVFGIKAESIQDGIHLFADLSMMKEVNNYVRWTFSDHKRNPNSKYDCVVSMNVLTLLDIAKNIGLYGTNCSLFDEFIDLLKNIPDVYWFVDDSVKITPSHNAYCNVIEPKLGSPVILSEDYNALKEHLTPYELDIHATITVDLVTDRATGLQMWRHADQTGGCELSQRYVDRSSADFRYPTDLIELEDESETELLKQHSQDLFMQYKSWMREGIGKYEKMKELLSFMGKKRSQEIARNLLPNIHTRIIQCRPLRQWKHFFDLRDTPHAQKEIMEDTRAIKSEFSRLGIPVERN